MNTPTSTIAGTETVQKPRKTIPGRALWIVLTCLLLAGIAVLAILIFLKPVTVEKIVAPVPPAEPASPEQLARANELDDQAAEISRQLADKLNQIDAPDCPPDQVLDRQAHTSLLDRHAGIIGAARAAVRTVPGTANRLQPGTIPGGTDSGQTEPAVLPGRATTPPIPPQTSALPEPPTTQGGARTKMSNSELSQSLENAVVIIIVNRSGGVGTGTGFFISPSHIVTNRHVIDGAKDGRVLITSEQLGDVQVASIQAQSRPKNGSAPGADFAILTIPRALGKGTLPITTHHSKLARVVAAGYPGISLGGDEGFMRLASGDRRAAPDLNLSEGAIRSTKAGSTVTVLDHTADVSGGNSGGPLVDKCGRVVGVNTFIKLDQKQSTKINSALASVDLLRFLQQNGFAQASDPVPCSE